VSGPKYFFCFLLCSLTLCAATIYSTTPVTLSPNLPSLSSQAPSASEMSALIALDGGKPARLVSAALVLGKLRRESSYEALSTSAGFAVPLKYATNNTGADLNTGSVIYTAKVSSFIPWTAREDTCNAGVAVEVTFGLPSINAPGQFIYGLSFNTPDSGQNHTAVSRPLNIAATKTSPSVRTNPISGTAYWNVPFAGK